MTQSQFRVAVTLPMALAVLSLTASCVGESGLPDPLREHLASQRNAEPNAMDWALLPVGIPVVIAGMASFFGMLRFRRWSRPLALATSGMSIVLLPLFGPTVEPGIVTALNYGSSMLFGAVLAYACSPAATWFQTQPPNKPLQPTSGAWLERSRPT